MEQTLSIIKPNAISKNVNGAIIQHFESQGLKVAAIKMVHLDTKTCSTFYKEHEGKPFFKELVDFMTSKPVILMVLSGSNAIEKNRKLMGATNPKEAEENTIRKLYGDSMGENAVHGSDSLESAKREISLFFKPEEILNS